MGNPTVAAILGYTDDPQLQAALALGSRLEGGWTPPFTPGDDGTSFGPYQIHLPAHPGVSAAEADDPTWATSYMGGSYRSGVNKQSDAAWTSDPEAAAEQAARAAERPAQDYIAARGAATVNAAWAATLDALPPTSAAALVTAGGAGPAASDTSGGGGIVGSVEGGIKKVLGIPGDVAGDAANAVGGALGDAFTALWDDAKPFVITMGFVGLGLALVLSGLVISTRGSRSSSTTTLPAVPAPSSGAAGSGGAAVGGGIAADLAPAAALA